MTDPALPQFLEAAGRSFAEAQAVLAGGSGLDTALVIADAELEVKAAVRTTDQGLVLQTISTADIRQGGVQPEALSTLKVRFVALGEPAAAPSRPGRTPRAVIEEVAARPELAGLRRIFTDLRVEPVFVPETRRWLVTVADPQGRTLRELVVPDEPPAR